MAHTREEGNNDFQFQWGKKRGVGQANKDIQFYESFKYDGIDYTLYDCVHLHEDGELEPYVGKILKIWEQVDGRKKVKILWFFRPTEVQKYLGDYTPLENEVFLGSGEGVGLTNINPLEAIAGKCCVICVLKDKRNPQPSKEDLEMADYIFKRTFDVQKCKISDKLSDKIAGIEVKFLLNRKTSEKPHSASKFDADGRVDLSFNDTNSDSLKLLERSKLVKVEAHHDEEKLKFAQDTGHPSLSDYRPSKKTRIIDDSVKSFNDSRKNKGNTQIRKLKIESDEDDLVEDYSQLHKESFERMKFSKKNAKLHVSVLESPVTVRKDTKADTQILDMTRLPDADRSRWFKEVPWEGKIQRADEQGTLVFVDNLDPSFTSVDVQDIMRHACNQRCRAKVISQTTFQNINYGRAYVVFDTREAADQAVQKINRGCLMHANGRPLICSKGLLKVPPKSSTLPGHMSIDKIKLQMQREEMKKAVSTSHCSQPNTIEYEMALHWMHIQEKYVNWYRELHEGHNDERIKNRLRRK